MSSLFPVRAMGSAPVNLFWMTLEVVNKSTHNLSAGFRILEEVEGEEGLWSCGKQPGPVGRGSGSDWHRGKQLRSPNPRFRRSRKGARGLIGRETAGGKTFSLALAETGKKMEGGGEAASREKQEDIPALPDCSGGGGGGAVETSLR
jgi:hypothetical protein